MDPRGSELDPWLCRVEAADFLILVLEQEFKSLVLDLKNVREQGTWVEFSGEFKRMDVVYLSVFLVTTHNNHLVFVKNCLMKVTRLWHIL